MYVYIFTCEFCVLYVYVHAHVHLCACIAKRYVHMPMLPLHTWHRCESIFTQS